jgi:photosystem II stability/assembly factor-like uncharacterized protein
MRLKSRRTAFSVRGRRVACLSRKGRLRQPRMFERLEPKLLLAAIQTWQVRGAGGGGALYSPSFNPANPQEIFLASDMGQLFHTTSDGAAWDTIDFRQIYGGPNSAVEFTANPQIDYSLDYGSGGDDVAPSKSTDGGVTWSPLAADPTGGSAVTVEADYNNPNRILVSDYSQLWISTDGGAHFAARFATSDSNGLLVAGAFFDGNNIDVGTNQGLLISTDGGATNFTVAPNTGIPSGQRIQSFAGAKENGIVRLWAVTGTAGDVFAGMQGYDNAYAGVYRIDNPNSPSATWTSMTSGISGGATPFFVRAALNDINTVYLAGGNSQTGNPTVLKSTTGGDNWLSVLQTAGNANVQTGWSGAGGDRDWSYGELALGFAVAPLDSTRLVITDDGFAHLSENSGASWRALYVTPGDLNPAGQLIVPKQPYQSSGLDNSASWDLTWTSPTNIIGSFTDLRSEVSNDGGSSWSFNYTGDTQNTMYRSIVVDRSGQEYVYAATATVHDLYQSTHLTDASIDSGTGQVLFSTDQGHTWQMMHNFGQVVSWIEADPNNPNRLYASVAKSSAGGIYVTTDAQAGAAATWTKLAAPPRTEGHAFNIQVLKDGTLVATYSGRRDATGAFTPSSGIFVSTNGGQAWQDVSDPGMLYWTKDVVVDPSDPNQNTWYVSVFSGWGGPPNGLGGLYRTTNRGQSWVKINALDRVNSLAIDPADANQAYLTTEIDGLWYTDNLQASVPTFTPVAGYHFMQPMRVVYNPYNSHEVWVTSFGGGLRVGEAIVPGDFTGDGLVTAADLPAMLTALADLNAYRTNHALTAADLLTLGDLNGDQAVTNADVQALIHNLQGPHNSNSVSAAVSALPTASANSASILPAVVTPAPQSLSVAASDISGEGGPSRAVTVAVRAQGLPSGPAASPALRIALPASTPISDHPTLPSVDDVFAGWGSFPWSRQKKLRPLSFSNTPFTWTEFVDQTAGGLIQINPRRGP